jgi:hypothetical protein
MQQQNKLHDELPLPLLIFLYISTFERKSETDGQTNFAVIYTGELAS